MNTFTLITALLLIGCASQAASPVDPSMLQHGIPASEYDLALRLYTDQALPGSDVVEVVDATTEALVLALDAIPPSSIDHQYRRGKWTVGEVLQHGIRYEQIMLETALLAAGRDIPRRHTRAYDQSTTIQGARGKTLATLRAEWLDVRAETHSALASLSPEELVAMGHLDGHRASVRMIALCISGHQQHHLSVLRNRYLAP